MKNTTTLTPKQIKEQIAVLDKKAIAKVAIISNPEVGSMEWTEIREKASQVFYDTAGKMEKIINSIDAK